MSWEGLDWQGGGLWQLLLPGHRERRQAAAAWGVGLLAEVASIGMLGASAWLIARAAERPALLLLTVPIALVRLFALSKGPARYAERLAAHDLALRALLRARLSAFGALERLLPGQHSELRQGDLLSRFVSDVEGIQEWYVRLVAPVLVATAAGAVAVAVSWSLITAAGAVIAAFVVVSLAIQVLVVPAVGAMGSELASELQGTREAVLVEILRAADELAVFGATEEAARRLASIEAARECSVRPRTWATASSHALGAAGGLAAAGAIAVSIASWRGRSVGSVAVVVVALVALGAAAALSPLADGAPRLGRALAGARRVASVIGLSSRAAAEALPASGVARESKHHDHAKTRLARSRETTGGTLRPPLLELQDVTVVGDPGRPPLLAHLNVVVPPGAHLGVWGPSGAGKTTLGHLLVGFVSLADGRILVDGKVLEREEMAWLQQLIAWSPQQPHVFRASVYSNLALARPSATPAECSAALEAVGLGYWLASLPRGLESRLQERGSSVSGGEAQRIGVARAILSGRPIVVLDEPSAHLDETGAVDLLERTRRHLVGRSLLWITHRQSELEHLDGVIALEGGHGVRYWS